MRPSSEVSKALALAQDLGNTAIQATALRQYFAEIQSETDSGSALAAYEKVLKLRRAIGDPTRVATCLFQLWATCSITVANLTPRKPPTGKPSKLVPTKKTSPGLLSDPYPWLRSTWNVIACRRLNTRLWIRSVSSKNPPMRIWRRLPIRFY